MAFLLGLANLLGSSNLKLGLSIPTRRVDVILAHMSLSAPFGASFDFKLPGFLGGRASRGFAGSSRTSDRLVIGCGSSWTRVFEGKRLVFEEPTAVAVQVETDSILTIGKSAQSLLGKTPSGVKVVFPIEFGRVAHPEHLKNFLQAVLRRINPGFSLWKSFSGPRGVFAQPCAITPVETQLFQEVLQQSGLGGLRTESGILGSFNSLALPEKKQNSSYCMIDIGAQTTEVAVFSAGQLAYEARWEWGGIRFTEMITEIMRQEEQLAVSWHTSEAVKVEFPGMAQARSKNSKIAIRGKDILSQTSKTVIVTAGIFADVFENYIAELLENFELFVSELPTELATSCLENGIYLTGGGSQISDLDTFLAEYLHMPIHLHPNPTLASVQGLVKLT